MFDVAKQLLKETLAEDSENTELQPADQFEILHIGDELEKDYFGAKNAGWNALMIDRTGCFKDPFSANEPITSVEVRLGKDGAINSTRKVQVIKDLQGLSAWTPDRI
jgi:FMN phosphatase YigB (HAD superfamily)